MLIPSTAAGPIRVLLVDDHRTVLWGLGRLIETAHPQLELVASATCLKEALVAVLAQPPDIVLLDLDLGGENGIDLLPDLRAHEGVKVIVLTGSNDGEAAERAMLAGARGLVHKNQPADAILKAIVHVHAGELWLERGTIGKLFGLRAAVSHDPRSTLTPAELRIVAAVLVHKSAPNKVIAQALRLSEHTLRNHLASIYGKLDIHRRLDLVLYAMQHRFGTSPG